MIRQLRSVCESLYYTFLKKYCIGLEGFWDRSVKQAAAEKKPRDSTLTLRWRNALSLGQNALATAVSARKTYEEKGGEASEATAIEAVKLLNQRYSVYCYAFFIGYMVY